MSKNQLRLLYIHHSGAWGGASGCLLNLIRHLNRDKYLPEVLLLKEESQICSKLKEYEIKYRIASSGFYRKFYKFLAHSEAGYLKWYNLPGFFKQGISWFLSRFFYAGKELCRHDYDIVHLNSSVLTDWLAPAKKRGKVIIHIREPFRRGKIDILNKFLKNQIRKYADKIIAISHDNAERLMIPGKTFVIYDFGQIPESPPDSFSYSSKKILYLGGSSSSKGFYTLVDSLDFISRDVKILFAGKYVIPGKRKTLRGLLKYLFSKERKRNSAIQKILNHPNAEMIGLVFNVSEYLNNVCCLISPFNVPHFSFPVIEAHMHSKPAIGSDVQGMDEIIDYEESGLLFPKDNPEALAAAINRITSDPCLASEMGQNGFIKAKSKFSPVNILLFEGIYDKIG